MKLFQFDYKNEISLRGKLHRIKIGGDVAL